MEDGGDVDELEMNDVYGLERVRMRRVEMSKDALLLTIAICMGHGVCIGLLSCIDMGP